MMSDGLLIFLLLCLPFVGVVVVLGAHRQATLAAGAVGVTMFAQLLLVGLIWMRVPTTESFSHLTESVAMRAEWSWLPTLGIKLSFGVDGINLLLLVLAVLVGPVALFASWREQTPPSTGVCVGLLLTQLGTIGCLLSLDLFVFYLCWECALLPLFFLIGRWGGPKSIQASIRLLMIGLAGSLMMMLGVAYVGWGVEGGSFSLLHLYQRGLPVADQRWLFWLFAIACLLKLPLFPFHSWLPDAQSEAPPAASILLAAVFLKLGALGVLRILLPLFPNALEGYSQALMILAVLGVIYGALIAMAQLDFMKLLAYICISHMSLLILGFLSLNEQAIQGSLLHMLSQGVGLAGLLFLAHTISQKRQSQHLSDYGGVRRATPLFSFFFFLFSMSFVGVPGLSGFVGELLILLGAFATNKLYALVACLGVLFGVTAVFWMMRRMLFGPIRHSQIRRLKDLNRRELGLVLIIGVMVVWLGIAPQPLLDKTAPSVKSLLRHIRQAQHRVPHPPKAQRSAYRRLATKRGTQR